MSSLARITVVVVKALARPFFVLLLNVQSNRECATYCARGKTLERERERRAANIMPSKQRKKRMKTLAAFDDDDSDEHEKNDTRDDADDADDACPVPKLIGDKRVRTRYMPSFVPKDEKKTTERRDVTTADAEGADRGAGDDGANVLWKQRRKLGDVSPQEEEEEEKEEKEKEEEEEEEEEGKGDGVGGVGAAAGGFIIG